MSAALSELVFNAEYNEALIHQVVTAYQAAARSGNSAQKTRAEVRGGGAKPWRQKGTGRARAGSRSSPIWRSGGVTFASKKRSYAQKVNKKMYRAAMRSILSELKRQERIVMMDDVKLAEPKTKLFIDWMKKHDLKRGLIVMDTIEHNLFLASRNVPNVAVIDCSEIDPVSLLWADKIILTSAAVKVLEEKLS